MDEQSRQKLDQLKTQQKEEPSHDKHLARNFLGSSALMIALLSIASFTMWFFNFPILKDSQSTIVSSVMDLTTTVGVMVFMVIIFKMVKSTFTGEIESYGDIIFAAVIASVIKLLLLSNLAFTIPYITVVFAIITLCISIWGLLSFIESAQEESSIIRLIYWCGRQSQMAALNSVIQQRNNIQGQLLSLQRSLSQDEYVPEGAAIFTDGTEEGNIRARAMADAKQYYEILLAGESVSVERLRQEFEWKSAQTRALKARNRLVEVRAITPNKEILNRDQPAVERDLAQQIADTLS